MNARLQRLLTPAQTSPTDSFTWNDKRSKSKQIVSGLRMAGGLIAGFIVMMAAWLGLFGVSEDHSAQSSGSVLPSLAPLVVAAIIMLWTANRWAPFVIMLFFGQAVFKMVAVLLFGPDSYYSSHSISRTEVAEFLAYSLAVVALTSRFVGTRPASTTVFDR